MDNKSETSKGGKNNGCSILPTTSKKVRLEHSSRSLSEYTIEEPAIYAISLLFPRKLSIPQEGRPIGTHPQHPFQWKRRVINPYSGFVARNTQRTRVGRLTMVTAVVTVHDGAILVGGEPLPVVRHVKGVPAKLADHE